MNERAERRLFLAVFVVASVLASPVPRNTELAAAIAHGRLWVDPEAHGQRFDRAWMPLGIPSAAASLGAVMPRDDWGHIYEGGSPGLHFALVLPYVSFRHLFEGAKLDAVLAIVGAALPLAFGAVGAKRAVERATGAGAAEGEQARKAERSAVAAGALFALGTIALPYGTRLLKHSLSLALLTWALAVVLGREERGERKPALSGLLAGLAVVTDMNAALAAAFVLLLSIGRGGVGRFIAGTLPAVLFLSWYHTACFGAPWRTAYDERADPAVQELIGHGFYGFVAPSPRIALEVLLGDRGWLATQPIALVGLAGLVALARERGVARVALAAVAAIVIANASRPYDWQGGWAHGCRYSIGALPFVAIGIPRGLELLGKREARPVAALSVLVAWIGASVNWWWVGSFVGNARVFFVLGPRSWALAALVLGCDPERVPWTSVLLAAIACSIAFTIAASLLELRPRAAVVFVALAPWLAAIPFAARTASGGSIAVHRAYERSYEVEALDTALATSDPEKVRALYAIATRFHEGADRRLLLALAERVLVLDPTDAKAAAIRDALTPPR